MSTCIRCFVTGRVQGVFFRASTQELANKLGITGFARNLPDRRVEVLACGDSQSLERLTKWLSVGPPLAEVTDMVCESVNPDAIPTGFSTE